MFLVIAERGDANALGEAGDKSFASLAQLRKSLADARVGDDVYVLKDADGNEHRFTFKPWASRNSDETFLQLTFRQYNPRVYGGGKAHPLPPKGVYEL